MLKKRWKEIILAGLAAGILTIGSIQPVFASSDNLMDAVLNEESDNSVGNVVNSKYR